MALAGERKAAQIAGLSRYFTGKPCAKGHVADRTVSNKACVQCLNDARSIRHKENIEEERALRRQYYWSNPDREREARRTYGKKNRKREAITNKAWLKANPDKAQEYNRRNYASRRDIILAYAKEWRAKNKERCVHHGNKKRAIKAAAIPIISDEMRPFFDAEILQIYAECKTVSELTSIRHDVDHIFPLSKGGVHAPWNLRIILRVENQRKKDKWPKHEPVQVLWRGELMSRLITEIPS